MEPVLALDADNTHLYPGARLTADEGLAALSGPTEAIVLFRDHSTADAVLTRAGDEFELRVEAYSTAAGTGIDAKSWVLRAGDDRSLVVKRRADV